MSRMRTIGSLAGGAALAAALAACASTGPAGPIDPETLYRSRCALCHPPWDPADYEPGEWPGYMKKYGPRSGLTQAERDAVLAYLVREAGKR